MWPVTVVHLDGAATCCWRWPGHEQCKTASWRSKRPVQNIIAQYRKLRKRASIHRRALDESHRAFVSQNRPRVHCDTNSQEVSLKSSNFCTYSTLCIETIASSTEGHFLHSPGGVEAALQLQQIAVPSLPAKPETALI